VPPFSSLTDLLHGQNMAKGVKTEQDFSKMSKKIDRMIDNDFDIIKETLQT
jgi:hypothetical protein